MLNFQEMFLEAAEKDNLEKNPFGTLIVSEEDWDFLQKLMNEPIKINPYYEKALEDYRKAFEEIC